ncbi:hypothetical protein D047_4964A, partial [Vibrio parahaemolyticus VPTS-2010_2]
MLIIARERVKTFNDTHSIWNA